MLWRADHDDFKANFSFAKTWNYLRDKRSDVTWRKIAFMVWYGLRLEIVYPHEIEWKVGGIDQCCILCGEKNETMDHMFFACLYSFTVWMNIAGRLIGSAITLDWNHTVASLMLPAHSRLDHVFKRMVFQTVFYSVWKEWNSRRHGGIWVTTKKLNRTIDKQIRNQISSLR